MSNDPKIVGSNQAVASTRNICEKVFAKMEGAIAQFVDDLTNYSKFMGLNRGTVSARNIL